MSGKDNIFLWLLMLLACLVFCWILVIQIELKDKGFGPKELSALLTKIQVQYSSFLKMNI